MLARGLCRSCSSTLHCNSPIFRPPFCPTRPPHRSYHASTPAQGPAAGGSSAGALAPFVSELDRIAPSFKINGERIRIIDTPSEFYKTLKDKIRKAERRIFLSTLYIGKTETELIATLEESLRAKPKLKVNILTDALRGTREAPSTSTASILAPLVVEFGPERVEIRMYHTPNLTGLRKKFAPRRINEGWGLQHMKLYGFDDEIILSGANLSSDYFTNRQDRYHVFSSREVTDWFAHLHHAIGSLSFLVKPLACSSAEFILTWPDTNSGPSPLENPIQFVAESSALLRGLIPPSTALAASTTRPSTEDHDKDTRIYVLAQLSQLLSPDTSTELPAITHILRALSQPQYAGSSWTFTAGYFNPAPSLTQLLLATASRTGTVITAAPEANGFYKSPGVSSLLPDAYTLLAHRFLRAVDSACKSSEVQLKEWRRGTVGTPDGWTYHAKGLWVTMPGATEPAMTVVGSSNYTKRSYSLDLEAGAVVVTSNEGLTRRLGEEVRWLEGGAEKVTSADFASNRKRVGVHVRVAMWIVKVLGGAL